MAMVILINFNSMNRLHLWSSSEMSFHRFNLVTTASECVISRFTCLIDMDWYFSVFTIRLSGPRERSGVEKWKKSACYAIEQQEWYLITARKYCNNLLFLFEVNKFDGHMWYNNIVIQLMIVWKICACRTKLRYKITSVSHLRGNN